MEINYVTVLLSVIFLASVAALFHEGLWSNAITLITVISAALLATNWFEPLARLFESMAPTYTYLWDFTAIWTMFFVSFTVLRIMTDLLSRQQVRFKAPMNYIGSGIFAMWAAWVLVCFTATTLHTAPLARNFMGGSFQPKPDSKMFFGTAPDQQWLAFVGKVSRGALRTSPMADAPKGATNNEFDPQADFIFKYAQRRSDFEAQIDTLVRRGN